jgi:hypothetical protein
VGPRAGLDAVVKRKSPFPRQALNPILNWFKPVNSFTINLYQTQVTIVFPICLFRLGFRIKILYSLHEDVSKKRLTTQNDCTTTTTTTTTTIT